MALAVLSTPDLLQSIVAFQGGLREDLLPTWGLPSGIRMSLARGHAFYLPTWVAQFGIDRLPLLIDAFPRLKSRIPVVAASAGLVDVLECMHRHFNLCHLTNGLVSHAATKGQPHVVRYLHCIEYEDDIDHAIKQAALHGHVCVLQCLRETYARTSGLNGYAVATEAISVGNVDVLEWLFRVAKLNASKRHHVLEVCFNDALEEDNMQVVAWLVDQMPPAMAKVAHDVERYQQMHLHDLTFHDLAHPTNLLTKLFARCTNKRRYTQLIPHLQTVLDHMPAFQERNSRATRTAERHCLVLATKHYSLDVMRWLVDSRAMPRAIVVDVLVTQHCGVRVMYRAMQRHDTDMLAFLDTYFENNTAKHAMTSKWMVVVKRRGPDHWMTWLDTLIVSNNHRGENRSQVRSMLENVPRDPDTRPNLAVPGLGDLLLHLSFVLYLVREVPVDGPLDTWFPRHAQHKTPSRRLTRWFDSLVACHGGRIAVMAHCLPALAARANKPRTTLKMIHAAWRLCYDDNEVCKNEILQVEEEMLRRAVVAGHWKVVVWLVRRMAADNAVDRAVLRCQDRNPSLRSYAAKLDRGVHMGI
ncbi:Aste57867_19884 [Aphanomyces stellatus]|uniref:Aste57867_19884 protein n=1 Tax=Aphanomyces stellatus TaxID=120398 RepID=A0A485LDP0_9STRA|nr:hypothetical protein As57867_019818 [Aphanomyces stellatus]VFT96582.1 Aste57867_19884 [Aphanomyces stellatus]